MYHPRGQNIPQKTPHNVLKQPHSLLIHQLSNHVAQHSTHGIESLVCLADILQAHVIEQYLLHDEDCDRFAQLGPRLHNTEAERDDLGGEEEVDDFGAVVFDEGADHAQGGQAKIFEGPGFRGRV